MAGIAIPGYRPPARPAAPPPQAGAYRPTVGGQQYLPSQEELALEAQQAAARRQAQDDAWAEQDRIEGSRRQGEADAFANQQYADSRSDRREGIASLEQMRQDIRGLDLGGGAIGGSGGGGGTGGGGAYNPAADAATYGRAKERTGLAMQSAIKGLRENMAERWMTGPGNGLEAKGLGDIYDAGLGDLAETDRQLAEGTAARGFQSSEAAAQRGWQSGENAADRAAQQTNSRLSALLQLYGMVY